MSDEGVTQAVWVTHEMTSLAHIREVVHQLEEANAMEFAQITIMAVGDQSAIVLPNGTVLQKANIPAQGILVLPA